MPPQLSPIKFRVFNLKARFVQIDKQFILEFENGRLFSFSLRGEETVLEAIDRFERLNAGCAEVAFTASALKQKDCEIEHEGQTFRACEYAPRKGYICNGTHSFLFHFEFEGLPFWDALSQVADDFQYDQVALQNLRKLVAKQLVQAQA